MSLLEPGLMTRLKRSRLMPRLAGATTGVGERRSRAKGLGLEFEDYRDYQPGDDIRHLDPHVHARLGQNVIRQFALSQQMNVTVILDLTASMAAGDPAKHLMAARLAAMLAFVAVSGGDRVRVGAWSAGRMHWHAVTGSQRQLAGLLRWLENLHPAGSGDQLQLARISAPRLLPGGMLVVIGDMYSEGHREALGIWRARGQEVVAIQVLAPAELDPALLGDGPVSLLDSETGEELDMTLSAGSISRYREVFDSWLEGIRSAVHARDGRHLLVRSDADLESDVLPDWLQKGLIR